MTKPARVRIYPVEHSGVGFRPYVDGVPAVVTDCSPTRARRLVATGAFSYEPAPPAAPDNPQGTAETEPASLEE